MSVTICADGSAPADAHPRVEIDRSNPGDRWRYRCPNNHHARWVPRGGYVLCHSCAEMVDVSPVYRELWDAREERTVPWASVEIVDDGARL